MSFIAWTKIGSLLPTEEVLCANENGEILKGKVRTDENGTLVCESGTNVIYEPYWFASPNPPPKYRENAVIPQVQALIARIEPQLTEVVVFPSGAIKHKGEQIEEDYYFLADRQGEHYVGLENHPANLLWEIEELLRQMDRPSRAMLITSTTYEPFDNLPL